MRFVNPTIVIREHHQQNVNNKNKMLNDKNEMLPIKIKIAKNIILLEFTKIEIH